MNQIMSDDIVAEIKKKYHVDLKKVQEEMLTLGIIDSELTVDQIEQIVKNPFIRYARVFEGIDFEENEHDSFKEAFSSKQV